MTAAVEQLGYIGFGVSDPDAWADFLTGTLGCQAGHTSADGTRHFRLDHHLSRIQVRPTGEGDLVALGWLVSGRSELAELEKNLAAAGFPPERGSQELAMERGVTEIIVVDDPCGLRNEIGFGPAVSTEPFVAGRPMAKGFVAGEQGAGHVVLSSQDPDAYVRFYEEVLGLQVSDHVQIPGPPGRPGFSIAFYHANERHHSLAFPLIPLPPLGKRIQHFMVELEDLDDLGRGQQIAHERGELLNYLGRHSNDLMLSCYLTTPDGIGVEYGWGARSVVPGEPMRLFTDGDLWGHQVGGERSIFDIVVPDGPPPDGLAVPASVEGAQV